MTLPEARDCSCGLAEAWLGNVRFLLSPPSSGVISSSTRLQAGSPGRGWQLQEQTAQLFALLSPDKTESPKCPKLALIPHSLVIFHQVPFLLHQTSSHKH